MTTPSPAEWPDDFPFKKKALVCVHCLQPIADRSTYIPSPTGPLHPHCWEANQRPSTRDLEAALREARTTIVNWMDSEYRLPGAGRLIDSINAALSPAIRAGAKP